MDYDKLSYSEAKRLIKVANSAVSAVNSLPVMSAPVAPITTTATPTTTTTATPTASPSFISSIADAGTDWLSKLPEMYKENPVPWNIGIGALGGAALGGLSSLWQPKRRRNLLSRLITGGLIGSMGGLAASGVSGGFKVNPSREEADVKLKTGLNDVTTREALGATIANPTGTPQPTDENPNPKDVGPVTNAVTNFSALANAVANGDLSIIDLIKTQPGGSILDPLNPEVPAASQWSALPAAVAGALALKANPIKSSLPGVLANWATFGAAPTRATRVLNELRGLLGNEPATLAALNQAIAEHRISLIKNPIQRIKQILVSPIHGGQVARALKGHTPPGGVRPGVNQQYAFSPQAIQSAANEQIAVAGENIAKAQAGSLRATQKADQLATQLQAAKTPAMKRALKSQLAVAEAEVAVAEAAVKRHAATLAKAEQAAASGGLTGSAWKQMLNKAIQNKRPGLGLRGTRIGLGATLGAGGAFAAGDYATGLHEQRRQAWIDEAKNILRDRNREYGAYASPEIIEKIAPYLDE